MLTSFTVNAQDFPRGDVNKDEIVNITDVTDLINNLLNGVEDGDVNLDGLVNITDVTDLINFLLSGEWPDEPQPVEEYVDLGLPSGTQWATHNVGASSPEEYGDHFAWGVAEPVIYYWWYTYPWVEIVENNRLRYIKYNTDSNIGIVDNKIELDPEDDAAYVNWGPEWRMPSRDQVLELIENCTWQWTEMNGVSGQLVTGPNGKTIFLPAAGIRTEYDLDYANEYGFYWSRTLCIIGTNYVVPENGCALFFDSETMSEGSGSRCNGHAIRPVRASQD